LESLVSTKLLKLQIIFSKLFSSVIVVLIYICQPINRDHLKSRVRMMRSRLGKEMGIYVNVQKLARICLVASTSNYIIAFTGEGNV